MELAKILSVNRICHKDTEIEVTEPRAQTRLPGLMVISEELVEALGNRRGTITREMPPPLLIVEVVSPGKLNEEPDRYERSEYAARGILAYWIINPQQEKVTVLTLVAGLYEEAKYAGEMPIQSQSEALKLTAHQILRAGM